VPAAVLNLLLDLEELEYLRMQDPVGRAVGWGVEGDAIAQSSVPVTNLIKAENRQNGTPNRQPAGDLRIGPETVRNTALT